ncbi:hypothetical protein [Nocardia mexicana]|uniref:DUF8017 domain-containing protein n=1 Tax=Nocardia mexicana TaxID=279262 RepID=A0A370H530_9NOCA|nr:hypothetical protein [Nocardia mexicana]RDI50592.1 hypothetical protein DFR68_10569 [Nocardia mexicana]
MTDDRQWWERPAPGYEPTGQPHPSPAPGYQQQPYEYPPLDAPQAYEYPALESQQPYPGNYQPMPYGAPPPRRNTGLIVALVVGMVVVVLAVAGGLVLVSKSSRDDKPSAAATSTARTTSAPRPTTATPAPPTSARRSSTTTAVIPGFQGVAVPARGIAYDVPAGWKVDTETMIRGFEDDKGNRISGTGSTVDGEDYCASSNRTTSFVSRSDVPDPAAAATDVGKKAAEYGFNSPTDATTAAPTPLTTGTGIAGQLTETSGTWKPEDSACTTSKFTVYTFAFPGPQNPMLVLTIAADRGVPGEVTPDLARQIYSSVRKL